MMSSLSVIIAILELGRAVPLSVSEDSVVTELSAGELIVTCSTGLFVEGVKARFSLESGAFSDDVRDELLARFIP